MKHIIALSGGKDSTAMALWLKENEPRDYIYICTPTGDELPDLFQHLAFLETHLEQEIIRLYHPDYPSLNHLIDHFQALPNFRQRWCTRILKIEPAMEFYLQNQPCTAYVGLRADEEQRGGIYGEVCEQVYPLAENGFGLRHVWQYLQDRDIQIPKRTDCARCFWQRIGEWWELWKDYPEIWKHAEEQEIRLGYTFRTPGKDNWPIALRDLRKEFERGGVPRKAGNLNMFENYHQCRVCSL